LLLSDQFTDNVIQAPVIIDQELFPVKILFEITGFAICTDFNSGAAVDLRDPVLQQTVRKAAGSLAVRIIPVYGTASLKMAIILVKSSLLTKCAVDMLTDDAS